MTWIAFFLIVGSAGLHASWNLIAKKHHATIPYCALIGTVSSLLWCNVLFWTPVRITGLPLSFWLCLFGTGLCGALYNFGTCQVFKKLDMTCSYPLMRALPLILTTVVTSVIGFGRPLSFTACLGFLIAFFGSLLMPLNKFSNMKLSNYFNSGFLFVLVCACGTTGYTIFDKASMVCMGKTMPEVTAPVLAVTYCAFRDMILACMCWTLTLVSSDNRKIMKDLLFVRKDRSPILVSIIGSTGYLLILMAMNYVTNVSYVQVFRQLGLPIGMLLGIIFLKEKASLPKWIGVFLIVTGLVIAIL